MHYPHSTIADPSQTSVSLLVSLLGPTKLASDQRVIPVPGRGRSDCLLIGLALLQRGAVARGQLLVQLWPEQSAGLAGQALNSLTSELNKLCRKHFACDPLILHEQGYYRFNYEAGVGTDIDQFYAWAAWGQQQLQAGDSVAGLAGCEQAVALYRADLGCGDLSGDFSIGALLARERLRTTLLDLLTALANYYYTHGDAVQALHYLQRLLAREPCREDAHRQVMHCYLHLGQRLGALPQYQLCAQILALEFAAQPEPATVELFDQIRTNAVRINSGIVQRNAPGSVLPQL